VHGFAGKDPQALARSELLAAHQALPALLATVGDFNALGQYGLPSDIGNAHTKVRGFSSTYEAIKYEP
jgi:hypothetical protein